MYLVSIYFDEKTDKIIRRYINQMAEKTGNTFMTEGNVPPHITISAFETKRESAVVEKLEEAVSRINGGTLQWASVGVFLPYVIYLVPVLNEYLQFLSEVIYENISGVENTIISQYYRPYQWLPHTTIGKKLSTEEMKIAFDVLQNSFGMFSGKVERIGLAKTNPYQEIFSWDILNGSKINVGVDDFK